MSKYIIKSCISSHNEKYEHLIDSIIERYIKWTNLAITEYIQNSVKHIQPPKQIDFIATGNNDVETLYSMLACGFVLYDINAEQVVSPNKYTHYSAKQYSVNTQNFNLFISLLDKCNIKYAVDNENINMALLFLNSIFGDIATNKLVIFLKETQKYKDVVIKQINVRKQQYRANYENIIGYKEQNESEISLKSVLAIKNFDGYKDSSDTARLCASNTIMSSKTIQSMLDAIYSNIEQQITSHDNINAIHKHAYLKTIAGKCKQAYKTHWFDGLMVKTSIRNTQLLHQLSQYYLTHLAHILTNSQYMVSRNVDYTKNIFQHISNEMFGDINKSGYSAILRSIYINTVDIESWLLDWIKCTDIMYYGVKIKHKITKSKIADNLKIGFILENIYNRTNNILYKNA